MHVTFVLPLKLISLTNLSAAYETVYHFFCRRRLRFELVDTRHRLFDIGIDLLLQVEMCLDVCIHMEQKWPELKPRGSYKYVGAMDNCPKIL